MKILAVDLATFSGVAFGRPTEAPTTWTVDFGQWRDHDARLSQVLRWMRHMHSRLKPDLLVVESAVGGQDANALLIGMVACLRAQAKDLGIQTVAYPVQSVRKHFIGKHMTARDFPHLNQAAAKKAIKGIVFARCRALGWEVQSLDAADAAALFDYACGQERKEHLLTTAPGLFQKKPQKQSSPGGDATPLRA